MYAEYVNSRNSLQRMVNTSAAPTQSCPAAICSNKRRGGVTAEVKVGKVKKQLMVPVAKAAANCQKNHCSEQSLLCFFFFSLYLWWTIVVVVAAAVVVCAVFVVLFDLKVDPIFFHKCRAWFDSPMLALV